MLIARHFTLLFEIRHFTLLFEIMLRRVARAGAWKKNRGILPSRNVAFLSNAP
jgi:hypothetical protein